MSILIEKKKERKAGEPKTLSLPAMFPTNLS